MSRDPFQAPIVAPSAASSNAAAPAVEIVTALGDSVLAVDQLTPAPPRSSRARLMLTIGGGLLLAAATTFALGVRDAAHEASARADWQQQHRPSWAFHPTHHAISADILALGGALAGLGLCVGGLLSSRSAARTSFAFGVGDQVDVPLADAGRAHTLVKADGAGGFVVDIRGLTGELRGAGKPVALAELQAAGQLELPVRVDTHVRARVGRTTFHVRGLHAPARPLGPAPIFAERRGLTFFAGSAVAHIAVLGLMTLASPEQDSLTGDLDVEEENRLVALSSSHEEPPPPPPENGDDDGGEAVPSEAASMALTDGTLGHADGSTNPARLKVADRGMTPQMSREVAIAAATRAGVIGAMEMVGPVRTLEGGSIASGMDDLDLTGGLDGGGDGAPIGSFGWGVSGFGAGCGTVGGTLCQGYKAGPYATIGEPGGHGHNLRMLPGFGPGPGKRVAHAPAVDIGKPTACSDDDPCLDEAMIRRYMRRNLEKIGYCYEKELLGNDGLEGTVVAKFTLDGNGAVIESKASGVSPEVSGCIASVISNIKFPKIGGAGIYPIKYPFNLRPAGK
jgi:hypothetical protein